MARIAVVGSGIAGLASAWLLSRRHHVTLYEAEARPGGHSHTVDVTLDGISHPVDTGFLVLNPRTYPQLVALFEHLGVECAASDMSFSVRVDEAGLEWAGSNLATLFAQPRNLARGDFWRMMLDILRFNREAPRDLRGGLLGGLTLGAYLASGGYGKAFRDWYLLPMAAAIWSCPTGRMLDFPAATLVRFFDNHGLLLVSGRPRWLTVSGGSREYVRRLLAGITDVRLATPVSAVGRDDGGVWVHAGGAADRHDQVVLACHADQSLALLGEGADVEERRLLAAVPYQPNQAVLHTDSSFLPRNPDLWSAWNYSAGAAAPSGTPVSVSYLVNRLQPLPFSRPVIVTLNPHREVRPETVIARHDYAHPVFDAAAIAAQSRLPAIQGRRRAWFCGAWTRYGFHEDGLASALAVAAALGEKAPWARSTAVDPA